MNGKSSQRKGAHAERELAEQISELLGVTARKGSSPYLPGLIAPDVLGIDGLHIEVKRRESFSIPAALKQSHADAAHGDVAAVCHRPNKHPWMITVELADLPKLAQAITRIIKEPNA